MLSLRENAVNLGDSWQLAVGGVFLLGGAVAAGAVIGSRSAGQRISRLKAERDRLRELLQIAEHEGGLPTRRGGSNARRLRRTVKLRLRSVEQRLGRRQRRAPAWTERYGQRGS